MKHKPPIKPREGIQKLGDNPAFQQILNSRKAKEGIEPDCGYPHPPMQPVPHGFREVAYHPEAGIRVTQSTDQATVGIQFSEECRAIRGGLGSEVELLAAEVLSFNPKSRQWERSDIDHPAANREAAKRFGKELADRRAGPVMSV